MQIKVEYIDKLLEKELEIRFAEFDWFGLWMCNNYEDVTIIDITQEE